MTQIPNGSDHAINLTINGSDGNPIDISACEEIRVSVYQKRELILEEFTLTGSTVEIVDGPEGKILCRLNRAALVNVKEAKLFAQAVVDVTSADYAGGFKRSIVTDMILGVIKYSV